MSFSRAAPRVGAFRRRRWGIWVAPFGRAVKRSFAVSPEGAYSWYASGQGPGHCRRDVPRLKRLLLVRPTTSRLAEPYTIGLTWHQSLSFKVI